MQIRNSQALQTDALSLKRIGRLLVLVSYRACDVDVSSFMLTFFFFSHSLIPGQLALRAGNEKEEGETADTVGCCSLRVEHINLHPELDGQEYVVEFDFLGKDSIRYYNKVPVEKRVS